MKHPPLTSRVIYGQAGMEWLRDHLPGSYSKVVVLADSNTARHCYPLVRAYLPAHKLLKVRAGEQSKNIETGQRIWEELSKGEADRKALLINLGGGMICDLGGFAASLYKRGIDFIHIPTTLMAQADAAWGGKTAVNFGGYKNQLGVFNAPVAVLVMHRFLGTLPGRQLLAGFAEVVKHALVSDSKAFDRIARLRMVPPVTLMPWIRFSIRTKRGVVSKDPYDKGIRQSLNFGHTVGHALEALFMGKGKKKMLHGEAVAAGMLAESIISYRLNRITKEEFARIRNFIPGHYPLPELGKADMRKIMAAVRQDKKKGSGKIRMTLLNGIGSCQVGCAVSEAQVMRALREINLSLSK